MGEGKKNKLIIRPEEKYPEVDSFVMVNVKQVGLPVPEVYAIATARSVFGVELP